MTDQRQDEPDLIATHTTAASASVAAWVAKHHGLAVQHCHLIRRGLNDNYALRTEDGARYVARVCSIRPRGDFNIDFEVSLLSHLHASGAGVAAPVAATNGSTHVRLRFPEGPRALALFRHADGAPPESLEDFELTGRTLAEIHVAARTYAGPPSRYTLDGHHLAGRTLAYLETHPDINAASRQTYRNLIDALLVELAATEPRLTRVVCHGDTHGFNNYVSAADSEGAKTSTFFDFDDAGPGFLAYDLCVMPWSYLFRKTLKAPDDVLRERWTRYLEGYRTAGVVSEHDIAALPLFIQLRHLWNLGEAAGRLHHWGTSSVPVDWLRKQVEVLADWKALDLRG